MSGTRKPTDADYVRDHDRQLRRAALASMVGTTIEW